MILFEICYYVGSVLKEDESKVEIDNKIMFRILN